MKVANRSVPAADFHRGHKWASCQSALLAPAARGWWLNEMQEDKKPVLRCGTVYPQSFTLLFFFFFSFSDWANHPIVPRPLPAPLWLVGATEHRQREVERVEEITRKTAFCYGFIFLPSFLPSLPSQTRDHYLRFSRNAHIRAIHLAHFNGSLIII